MSCVHLKTTVARLFDPLIQPIPIPLLLRVALPKQRLRDNWSFSKFKQLVCLTHTRVSSDDIWEKWKYHVRTWRMQWRVASFNVEEKTRFLIQTWEFSFERMGDGKEELKFWHKYLFPFSLHFFFPGSKTAKMTFLS